ncbi:unnamed protein product [Brachionus calyciflorus]|uniref:Uncharacterized protein n=1 Tax=Brachionus calyciflorus TaxID=104777 RepID=A0A814I8A4_9BILA|nr:unnamed protein product [Brachionus calyciflorus]
MKNIYQNQERENKKENKIIISSLSTENNFNYSSKDIASVIFRLFVICDYELFNAETIRILYDLIDKNPSISECNPLNLEEIDQLTLVKSKCLENFSTIEEAFIVPDTQVLPSSNVENNSSSNLTGDSSVDGPNNVNNLGQTVSLDKTYFEESLNRLRFEFETQLNQLKIQNNDPELFLTSERIREYEFKIKHLFNKKLRFEKNIAILNRHIEKNDAPSQLFHVNFPQPFLKHNEKFVLEYNQFISDSQKKIMKMAIKHLTDEINILEKDLKSFKKNLTGCVDSVDVFVADIENREIDFLKNEFLAADRKCENVKVKPYVVEKKETKVNKNYNESFNEFDKKSFNQKHGFKSRELSNFDNKVKRFNRQVNNSNSLENFPEYDNNNPRHVKNFSHFSHPKSYTNARYQDKTKSKSMSHSFSSSNEKEINSNVSNMANKNNKDDLEIFKINENVYQIGELEYNDNFILELSNILSFGSKFVPLPLYNRYSYYKNLYQSIDKCVIDFNTYLFFKKSLIQKEKLVFIENNLFFDSDENNIIFDFDLKKLSNKRNMSNLVGKIPILEESLMLRFNLLNELKYQKFDFYSNLSLKQFNVLVFFIKNKPFTIIDCDKNLGVAFISNDNNKNISLAHQNSSLTYKRLETNQLDSITNEINVCLNDLKNNKHISNQFYEKLLIKNKCNLGKFRILAKVHKDKFGIRPFINCSNQPTEKICIVIDLS